MALTILKKEYLFILLICVIPCLSTNFCSCFTQRYGIVNIFNLLINKIGILIMNNLVLLLINIRIHHQIIKSHRINQIIFQTRILILQSKIDLRIYVDTVTRKFTKWQILLISNYFYFNHCCEMPDQVNL